MNVTKESLDSEIRKYLELRLDYLKTIDGLSIVVSRVFALMENFPDGSQENITFLAHPLRILSHG